MIRYALRCEEAHRFEAWFASSGDFDRLKAAGHVSCAVCGSGAVEKELMAPAVASGEGSGRQRAAPELTAPASPTEQALVQLRRRIEATAENVGGDFPLEARRIHAGEAAERPIWGEARPAEAKALVEDGIPIVPLPFPARKAN